MINNSPINAIDKLGQQGELYIDGIPSDPSPTAPPTLPSDNIPKKQRKSVVKLTIGGETIVDVLEPPEAPDLSSWGRYICPCRGMDKKCNKLTPGKADVPLGTEVSCTKKEKTELVTLTILSGRRALFAVTHTNKRRYRCEVSNLFRRGVWKKKSAWKEMRVVQLFTFASK